MPKVDQKPDLQTTLNALAAGAERNTPPVEVFYGLSDLSSAEIAKFERVWKTLNDAYRFRVMQALAESAEADFEMDFRAVGLFGLQDSSPDVRSTAIDILWEDESLECLHALLKLANHDPNNEVRAAAVGALGRFVLLGECGDLPEDEYHKLETNTARLLLDTSLDVEIRRRALESLANSSHQAVPDQIKRAYKSGDHRWKVSALFSMGRTNDSQWEDYVLKEIESDDSELRYEAARAAGELGLLEAVPKLARLLIEDDREIQQVSVWALGEIGGKESIRILENIREVAEEIGDEDLIEAIEDALANANFMDSGMFGLYDS